MRYPRPILVYANPVRGYYIPNEYFHRSRPRVDDTYKLLVRNKGYSNLAYLLNAFITNTSQTLTDTGGTSRSISPTKTGGASGTATPVMASHPLGLNIGSSTSPHDVTRSELYTRHFTNPRGGSYFLEELTTETRIQTIHHYSFPAPGRTVGEAGLYAIFSHSATVHRFLLARAIISPAITRDPDTDYREGWRISFPANYTRWFIRAIMESANQGTSDLGFFVRDTTGAVRTIREHQPFAGSPDVMIGSDNTPPSPTDFHLRSPITSLGSQLQSVEIDTTLQECRIVRTGTYTPPSPITFGEIALYINLTDVGGTARRIMIARATLDPPVTLSAGVTYTLGIVLRLG